MPRRGSASRRCSILASPCATDRGETMNDVYVVAATRTPVGRARGVLRQVRADDLLIAAMRGALRQVPSLDPAAIEDVVMGCAMPEGEQGLNVARSAALLAGVPVHAGGMTVNRFCASGLSAIQIAADRIRVGAADVMLAGGVESMSRIPMGGFHPAPHPDLFLSRENEGLAYGMGLTAENVAQQWNVTREDQDAYALQSHQRALAAQQSGAFAQEITPLTVPHRTPLGESGEVAVHEALVEADEGPRADTSLQALSQLRPAFKAKGSVTAGNSSQMSDGAACLVLASAEAVKSHGLHPLARIVDFSVRGVAPEIMGIGPAKTVPSLLQRTGVSLQDIDWIELNEAFAAQVLAVQRLLGFDAARLNPVGGAIALGHPLGASGAIRVATLVHGLRRTSGRYGLVTLCVGMGQGIAGLFERV
ncbi:MAG: acetyl-CoA C-acyltransferase [Betaproteobacteria bacterium]|nr:acetyl-CoA C-acyltransferase [Betaproteobacteria bacterium]